MSPKKIILIILAFLLVLLTAGVYFGITRYKSMLVNPYSDSSSSPTPARNPNQPFSILLLGYGGENHEGGALTDSIILAQINPGTQKIKLISIPRDLWVQIPVGTSTPYFAKINSVFSVGDDIKKFPNLPPEYTGTAGGGQLLKKVVADVTGIAPDFFISVDFSGFAKAVDLLGGVDVNVERSFVDSLYPIAAKKDDTCGLTPEEVKVLTASLSGLKLEEKFPCRYETIEFKKGIVHMDGTTALKYVRSRHSSTDGGDFNRSARQRQFILAVKDKVINLNFFTKAIPLFNTLTNHIRTDISLSQMELFITQGLNYSNFAINSVPLTADDLLIDSWSVDRQAILIPKLGISQYDAIKQHLSE